MGWFSWPTENVYVVNLSLRYNYAHLSHSSLCHCVSYQPSTWRAALTDGGLISQQLLPPHCSSGSCSVRVAGRDQRAVDTVWTDLSRLLYLYDIQFALQSLKGCRSVISARWKQAVVCQRHSSRSAQCVYRMWVVLVCGWCMAFYSCSAARYVCPSAPLPATASVNTHKTHVYIHQQRPYVHARQIYNKMHKSVYQKCEYLLVFKVSLIVIWIYLGIGVFG